MIQKKCKIIFTVVEVIRGMTNAVYNFMNLKDAQRYLKHLKKQHDLDEDDVQMFESIVVE